MKISRRFLMVAAAGSLPAALAGCGFHPLYAPSGSKNHEVMSDLGLIDVGLVPERMGQLLRLAVQERLEGSGAPIEKQYDLQMILSFGEDQMGMLSDSSTTRLRYTGSVNYILRRRDSAHTFLASVNARMIDNANVFDNQPFATDLETENIERQMMQNLADLVVEKLGAYFHRHPGIKPDGKSDNKADSKSDNKSENKSGGQ
jgi:hypothetical protein